MMRAERLIKIAFAMWIAGWGVLTSGHADSQVHVIPMKGQGDLKQLEAQGVVVHSAGMPQKISELPSQKQRDEAFRKSGIEQSVRSWDQVDRDMLWLSARNGSYEQLVQQYPRLPRAQLKALHHILK